MRRALQAISLLLCLIPSRAFAHRLDEYLQATILSLDRDTVHATLRLVPGVAVASNVIASLDANGDGMLSDSEQQAYADRVLSDLSLRIDGQVLPLHLAAVSFPSMAQIRQGYGEIQITFTAPLIRGSGDRTLTFENHHRDDIAVYLVNCVVPQEPEVRILGQTRNQNQSIYQLTFTRSAPTATSHAGITFSGLVPAFRLGARHIAEGTDHLLFLLTLLLPAPLLAQSKRWMGPVAVRTSLQRIFTIVTAFTLGHSLTLALAVFNVVHLPERPVEVLIAVSILVSAVHAVRPIFPGWEPTIAALFGLIHGLAFASALTDLGFGQGYRVVSLLGFNLGIEATQIAVVASLLPSLLLLSRTRAYSWLRVVGAGFAAMVSVGWIVERVSGAASIVDPILEAIARHAPAGAAMLFTVSLVYWLARRPSLQQPSSTTVTS